MTKLKLYGILLTFALTGTMSAFAYTYHLGAERATLTQRLHASDSLVTALRGRAKALDTVYRTDTLRLQVARRQWDTVFANVERWDTLRVPVPADTVRIIVDRAEGAINACLIVAQTCEARVATRDSIISALRAQRPLLLNERDSRLKRVAKDMAKVGIGAGIGYFAGKRQ